MNVLHIGHSPILKDARILKYTKSLVKLNYNVSLLGIDDKRYPYDSNSRPNVGESDFKLLNIKSLRLKAISILKATFNSIFLITISFLLFKYFEFNLERVLSTNSLLESLIVIFFLFLFAFLFWRLLSSSLKAKLGEKYGVMKLILRISLLCALLITIGTDLNGFLDRINIINSDGLTYFDVYISGTLLSVAFITFFFISIDYIVLGGRPTKIILIKIYRSSQLLIFKGIFQIIKKVFGLLIFYRLYKKEFDTQEKYKNFDIFHVHDHIAILPAIIILRSRPNVALFWDIHELYIDRETTGIFTSLYVRLVLRLFGNRINHAFTINHAFRSIYQKVLAKNIQISVVMNATTKPIKNDLASPNLIQQKINVYNKKIILFQGGLSEGRGIRLLIDAMKNINDDYVLVFMGSGELEEFIYQKASTSSQIYLIPPVEHQVLLEWTSSAHLGIIPYENISKNHLYCTPNKLWEYPAANVPFVATDLIEINRFVGNYDVAYLLPREFKSSDISATINAIDDLSYSLKKNECKKCQQNEHWEKYETIIESVYQSYAV